MCMLFILLCFCVVGWSADIAVLIPQAAILAGDDPVNDPLAKEFTIETLIERGDVGIAWLINHLEQDLGHTANIYGTGEDDPGLVEEENDLIFITEEIGSGSVGRDYRIANKPVIFTESYILDDMGFTNGQSAFTGGAMTTTLKVVNSNHPITRGLPETFVPTINDPATGAPYVVTFGTVTDLGILAGIGDVLVVMPTSVNESANGVDLPADAPVVIALEAGSTLDAGDKNDARWVFIGYSDVDPNAAYGGVPEERTLNVLNEHGIRLLDQIIAWALGETVEIDNWNVY
ncbi:MAG: hypothetical protein C4527_10475 [Candidatus Omnitrophota bacterium]|nr:MAG: hypothetical protein C4527_10475 [Candidatus Omnitrophota bacterium]